MHFRIAHELPGRLRVRVSPQLVSEETARDLIPLLGGTGVVRSITISGRTGNVLIVFEPSAREQVCAGLAGYEPTPALGIARRLGRYSVSLDGDRQESAQDAGMTLSQAGSGGWMRFFAYVAIRPLLPPVVKAFVSLLRALPYLRNGVRAFRRGRINVDVLDAVAIGISLARRDFRAVGTITLMFALGRTLEEWTRRESRASLARSLVVDVDTVWVRRGDIELHISLLELEHGDEVVVRTGSSIPVDGVVTAGDASVNQSAMTGEALPVLRGVGASVCAGSVVEDGVLYIRPTRVGAETRVNQIVRFIEESESRKANVESRADALADKIVPFNFWLAALVFLLTRNLSRAASVLLVDYSCAIRLATPLAVLTSMREAARAGVLVKGGRFIESMATATVCVFDKTGTLTRAQPRVAHVVPFDAWDADDVLRLSACLEEHFPHPVARAVVRSAEAAGIDHHEEHAEVEYVVAHGVASRLDGKRVLVGSRHFVHEDEGIALDERKHEEVERWARQGYSLLHLAVDGELVGALCIEDPMREEAAEVVRGLREQGIERVIMLTGDTPATAATIAAAAGIEEWRAQVMPMDKADIVRELQAEGHIVLMVGDGVNDSPALSAADVGVAMRDGADLAREVSDVVLLGDELSELLVARQIAQTTLRRIRQNFGSSVALNTGYLGLGLVGRVQPSTIALLHNLTTVGVALNAMRPMLPPSPARGEDERGR
ncbi:MAG: heavy metal translocating P-type ATPase [Clostridiales bacterium]|nr:heavy metal translocating P-type ATPase [Clostridiales bacterium]